MPSFLANINLNGNQITNVVVEVLATAPTGVEGRIYFDSALDKLRYYNGTTWVSLDASAGGDATTLNGQAGTYYLDRTNHTGTQSADTITDGTTNKAFTAAEKTKLAGVATGATANSSDATLLARANHTGTQAASTISDFDTQVRTSRLDQMAVPTADLNINSRKLTSVADPTSAQDAATKAYVDAAAQGLSAKTSVRVATTAAGTLATSFENGDTVDGVTLATGNRILIKDQSAGAENGIYVVNASGAPTRATDFDSAAEVQAGAYVFVEEGTANADSGWVLTTDGTITLDTTALAFTQFSGAGQITAGTGLAKTGNTLSQDTANGYGVRKYTSNVGDGSSVDITITHNLGTRDVVVNVYQAASVYAMVFPDVEAATTNTVILRFAVAPTSNQYRVVIMG